MKAHIHYVKKKRKRPIRVNIIGDKSRYYFVARYCTNPKCLKPLVKVVG